MQNLFPYFLIPLSVVLYINYACEKFFSIDNTCIINSETDVSLNLHLADDIVSRLYI